MLKKQEMPNLSLPVLCFVLHSNIIFPRSIDIFSTLLNKLNQILFHLLAHSVIL